MAEAAHTDEAAKTAIRDDLTKAGLDLIEPASTRAIVMVWLNKAYPLIAARVRAEERQGIAAEIEREGRSEKHRQAFECRRGLFIARDIAAGSAVPVATPPLPVDVDQVRATAEAMLRWCDDPTASPTVLGSILASLLVGPVATPAEPGPWCEPHGRAHCSDCISRAASAAQNGQR